MDDIIRHLNEIDREIEKLKIFEVPKSLSWKTYTPTFSNTTLGSGSTAGRYCIIGKTMVIDGMFTLGAGSAVSGDVMMSMPAGVNVNITLGTRVVGEATFVDTGTTRYWGRVQVNGGDATVLNIVAEKVDGTYNVRATLAAAVPHTWAATDIMFAHAVVEIQ